MKKTSLSRLFLTSALLGSLLSVGCQYHARSPEDYSKETTKLLASKKGELKSCYDTLLKKDPKAKGVVAVTFKVEPGTGAIKDAKLDKQATTAPEPLGKCVLSAMEGLKLDPPDAREGVASFSYDFTPNKPKS